MAPVAVVPRHLPERNKRWNQSFFSHQNKRGIYLQTITAKKRRLKIRLVDVYERII